MKKYLSDWTNSKDESATTQMRVGALEPVWDLTQGWHPDVEIDNSFYDPHLRRPLQKIPVPHMPGIVNASPEGALTGHVMLRDGNYVAMAQPDKDAPIAPLFVRDLAGRIVYIGTTRHKQNSTKAGQAARMPFGSVLVSEKTMEGHNLLERVFFACFRFVEVSDKFSGRIAGTDGMRANLTYYAPNLYPYKLRLDTFYQDGWRLPQTERLFVVPTTDRGAADKASTALMNLWQQKPEDMPYEQFLETNEAELQNYFQQGCTLIPTVEAFNGLNKVGDNYEHLGFWPGRAVSGLHEVVTQEAHEAPQGTIIKVVEPGFVTDEQIHPARVIVSDGMAYKEAEAQRYAANPAPKRLYPDLRLPHQRTTSKWGATWLPQHPSDFEEPAIWGWEEASGGRFVQTRGPLWDPLHYYYECTSTVIDCYKNNRLRKNPNLVKVPDHMHERFYPVVEMRGFDSFNIPKKKQEAYTASLLPTTIFHHDDASCICPVGYHPLPMAFEYELDNWWFPDMAPKNRISDVIPLNVEKRLAEVIRPNIQPDRFLATIVGDKFDAPWATDPLTMSSLRSDPLENYPYLKRYLSPDVSADELIALAIPFLEAADEEAYPLFKMPTKVIRDMEANWPGLYQVFLAFSQKADKVQQFRYKMFTENYSEYLKAYWYMTPLGELFDRDDSQKDPKKSLPSSAVGGLAEF